jgi:hypothetical protein
MMNFSKNDFSKVRVGDEIFVLPNGIVTVTETNDDSFRAGDLHYRKEDGSLYNYAHFPIAFWSKPEIIIPAPPKRKVKKKIERWAAYDSADGELTFSNSEEQATQAVKRWNNDTRQD